MAALTPSILMMFAVSIVFQVIGISLLPATKGVTAIIPSLGCGISFLVGLGMMARLTNSGINLNILIPFMAATVPIFVIAVSILVYGESVSITKISLLVSACLVIGFASSIA